MALNIYPYNECVIISFVPGAKNPTRWSYHFSVVDRKSVAWIHMSEKLIWVRSVSDIGITCHSEGDKEETKRYGEI
jgi:hypothetical protein